MKLKRADILLKAIVLAGAMTAFSVGSWAAPGICANANTDTGTGGTGMGGTGIVAKGAGIGGTGMVAAAGSGQMQIAGSVVSSQGMVEAQSDGRSRLLTHGQPVCVGETIVTAHSGSVQIKLADGELVSVRPETQLKIEKFAFGGTKEDNVMLALLKGASRFITGKIGQKYPQNDLVRTPTVLIGVRGTDHEAMVILQGGSGRYPSGTYDKVNSGVTFIRTESGEVDIHPNQVGFAAKAADLPALLKDMPDFYNVNPSIRQEGEASGGGGKETETGKTGEPNGQSGDGQNGMGQPDSPAQSERPEPPAQSDPPELPALPEPPEPPEQP